MWMIISREKFYELLLDVSENLWIIDLEKGVCYDPWKITINEVYNMLVDGDNCVICMREVQCDGDNHG